MLKRLLLLLLMAGASSTIAHSSTTTLSFQTQVAWMSNVPPAKADQILKHSAPLLGITYQDACAAYQKGSLTIEEIGQNTNLYSVKLAGGGGIMTLIEDI